MTAEQERVLREFMERGRLRYPSYNELDEAAVADAIETLLSEQSKMAEDLSLCNAAVERAEQAEEQVRRLREAALDLACEYESHHGHQKCRSGSRCYVNEEMNKLILALGGMNVIRQRMLPPADRAALAETAQEEKK